MTVLLLTQLQDKHADALEVVFRQRAVASVRCDLADFPEQLTLEAHMEQASWRGMLTSHGVRIALESLQSIWFRRPRRYHAPAAYDEGTRVFLEREAYRGFLGVLQSLGCSHTLWVSRSERIQEAECKPLQLQVAQQVGLRVPRTLLTNEPAAVQDFYDACQGKIICKVVAKGSLRQDGVPSQVIYTNTVGHEHLAHLAGVRATAHCFQEYIPKALEVRAIVIGSQVFAAAIDSQRHATTKVDWRRSYPDLSYSVHTLPTDVHDYLLQVVRSFHLQFASMDLIVTPQGEYVWLELNPNGQYLWIEQRTELPLTEAMANLLLEPQEYAL